MPFTPRTISDNFEKLPFSDDEKALLRRCLETPWDDAPLLVYADWVEEHGEEERAEFIRKQVRSNEIFYWETIPKEVDIWRKNIFPTSKGRGDFFRGLCSHASRGFDYGSPAKLSKALNKLNWDWIFSLGFERRGMEYDQTLFFSPYLQQLTSFKLDGDSIGDNPDPMLSFVESPYLSNLTKLVFNYSEQLTNVKQLVQTKSLQNLITLEFHGAMFRKVEMKAFLEKNQLTSLSDFCIESGEVNLDAIRELASSDFAKRLTSLRLPNSRLTLKTAEVIAQTKNFNNLRKLDLAEGNLGNAGTKHLATSPHLGELNWLNLSQVNLSKVGVLAIGNSPTLSKLEYLDLSWNYLGDAGAITLTKSKHLESLKDLNLTECEIGTKGMLALVNSEFIDRLEVLRISGNEFDSEIITALAKNAYVSKLKELRFDLERTSKANRKILQKSPYLQQCKLIHDD